MKTKLIKVTKTDIRRGTRFSACYCPVALALYRAFDKPQYCIAGLGSIAVNHIEWITPVQVMKFMDAFDSGNPVEPFSFELPML